MFSVISVFNNPAKLQERLLEGLSRQTAPHQFIGVDNRSGRFSSASAALNHGAAQADGDWLLFVHQDVQLLEDDWLERAESLLRRVDPRGWHGLVGRTTKGRWRGWIRDRDMVFGEPFETPIEVQTLDEIVLIHRQRRGHQAFFDEGLTGWHAYGVDACCQAIRDGAKNSVLPLPVWHDSNSTNQAKLREAHAYVWNKHHAAFRRIHTTCGTLPNPYGWSGSYKIWRFFENWRDRRYRAWSSEPIRRSPWEVLEELTRNEPEVWCLHRRGRVERIEGRGFTDRTTNPRPIVHHFTGLTCVDAMADCLVIAPDLAEEFRLRGVLPANARRLIVAIHAENERSPWRWRDLLGPRWDCRLAVEKDKTRWAIIEVDLHNARSVPAICSA